MAHVFRGSKLPRARRDLGSGGSQNQACYEALRASTVLGALFYLTLIEILPSNLLACILIPASALAETEVVNEEWVIAPHDVHSVSFSLPIPMPVHIDMSPVKNADKGVTLRVVPSEDVNACSGASQGRCRSRGDFDGFAVRSFSHTGMIPAGQWTFFVTNSENIINRATVHVHLVANPGT